MPEPPEPAKAAAEPASAEASTEPTATLPAAEPAAEPLSELGADDRAHGILQDMHRQPVRV